MQDNKQIITKNKPDPRFSALDVCVIIPTYNNAATIQQVLEGVLAFTTNIILVNDGSTDTTKEIITSYSEKITVISYLPNRGKGYALRTGFQKALDCGFKYAITIDSDGQHFSKDLPLFLDKLEKAGPSVIMGARNMDQDAVPGKSSFGHKFSNFWFRVETGIACPDTQTGYRLYPLAPIRDMKFFTKKYEFEIEIIVRLAWKGVKLNAVPISVYYAPKEERISHFRPFKDFTRISLLNTVLVFIALFYIKPRDFFRPFFQKKNRKQHLKNLLANPGESNLKKANSLSFGVFMGIIPVWGFQLLIGIPLAHFFRLNKALFILAANISIPPMIPLIIFISYKIGKPFMGSRATSFAFTKNLSLKDIRPNLEQYLIGSIGLAIISGVLVWLISYFILTLCRKKNNLYTPVKRNN